jgi:NADPH:quinone reductase-like Zn-dependent oxidoreductase
MPRFTQADLDNLARLVAEGTLKPVIDRTYPLERIAEAHTYVDQGHKRGNVIIVVSP